jgi:lysine-specific histone demethylase 1
MPRQDQLSSESTELSEPPAKRLRITHNACDTASPITLGQLEPNATESQPLLPAGSHLVSPSERLYTGSSSTPNESTTSTDLTSSFDPKMSTSPQPNPLQSIPGHSVVFGPNVLDSGKVDLSTHLSTASNVSERHMHPV